MKLGSLLIYLVFFLISACTPSKLPPLSTPGQDGSGSAFVTPQNPVQAGSRHSWTITYTAAETGISKNGGVVFHIPPFWGWSPPQSTVPDRPGYVSVNCTDKSLELDTQINSSDKYILTRFKNGPLHPGQQIILVYGTGTAGARADIYAEKGERFYIKVDGDGDGYFTPIKDHPGIDILPNPVFRLQVTAPSTVTPGKPFRIQVAALDTADNWNKNFSQQTVLSSFPEGIRCREIPSENGNRLYTCTAGDTGTYMVTAKTDSGNISGESNPIIASNDKSDYTLYWGDIHGHSRLSDGSGTPDDYYDYARLAAGLEIAVLTDHDAWGFDRLDKHPEIWSHITDTTEAHHRPGSFITFPGYEYTHWTSGHMHVLFNEKKPPLFSSTDPRYNTPDKLWQALAGHQAITVPHHTGGGPIATDWNYYHPEFMPLAEICSIHGNSESAEAPRSIYKPKSGAFVRDALNRGCRLGIVASGDTHNGHPGMGDPSAPVGGMIAVYAKSLTRDAVWEAFKKRRVYGTSGKRIILDFKINGQDMGSILKTNEPPAIQIKLRVTGTDRLKLVEIIKNGKSLKNWSWADPSFSAAFTDSHPLPGDYYYLRVVQQDNHLAWSSPIWME